MVDLYPQLGTVISEKLKSDLHEIGFTGFEHIDKNKRDGRVRLTWVYPVEGEKEPFIVRLVLIDAELQIDFLSNPLGATFENSNIAGLLTYINKEIRKI